MISSFSLWLSRGSFAMCLSPISSFLTSLSWVSSAARPLDGARPNFDWSGHGSRRWLLWLLSLHLPLHLLLLWMVWPLRWSWHSFSAWLLTLTHSVMSCVSRIAQWQAYLGGFVASPSPSLEASEDEDDDDDDDEDKDASSFGDDEMTAWVTCPLLFVTKRRSSFGYESSHVLRGRVSIGFLLGGVFACNSALRNLVFMWKSCKGSVWESVKKSSKVCNSTESRDWISQQALGWQVAKAGTRVKHAGELKSHTSCCTIGQSPG